MICLALSQLLFAAPENASGFTYEGKSLSLLETQFDRSGQGRNRPLIKPIEGFCLEIIDKMAKANRYNHDPDEYQVNKEALHQRSCFFLSGFSCSQQSRRIKTIGKTINLKYSIFI